MLFTFDRLTGFIDYFESIEDVAKFWGVRPEVAQYVLDKGLSFMDYFLDEVAEDDKQRTNERIYGQNFRFDCRTELAGKRAN